MPPEIDLLAVDRGSVTAPAGCGKTQLIADTLQLHDGAKPFLILTHTNAGAAALRLRMKRGGVSSSKYRVATLDGFAMRLIAAFPKRSGHNPKVLQLANAKTDYPAIREAALGLLKAGHLTQTLRATYARLIVDEYQDCNIVQHGIVDALASALPTVVLGDPLQAIFGFAGHLVDWKTEVWPAFPAVGRLMTPWRWINAGTEPLGRWLIEIRKDLLNRRPVDISKAPPELVWVRLDPADPEGTRRTAALTRLEGQERNILIIGDAKNPRGRHQLTSQTRGATSVEAVDMSDLTGFARNLDLESEGALGTLVGFYGELMTGVGAAELCKRVTTIRGGRNKTEPTEVERSAVAFTEAPSMNTALWLLQTLEDQPNTRTYRPDMLHCCRTAMRSAASGKVSFLDAVLATRERNRHEGRPIGRRAVGSTLLLKGLEADAAVILEPEQMTPANLYVAMTRGARRLVICSASQTLTPAWS